MDGNVVLLLIALMILVAVVMVNGIMAATVMRLERFRVVREREREKAQAESGTLASAAASAAETALANAGPRAINVYVAALLVTGVPTVSFFGALLGSFSAGGWAYIAAGGATIAAVVGAITLCAGPDKGVKAASPPKTSGSASSPLVAMPPSVAEDEPAASKDTIVPTDEDAGDQAQRSPDDLNG